jgi:hypothetical protein
MPACSLVLYCLLITTTFQGEIASDETFERTTPGGEFIFTLRPIDHGWVIQVRERGRERDLSSLTTPYRYTNPKYIEGWHFRNVTNTGPNDGSVNQPQRRRRFTFSPAVGRTINARGPGSSPEDIERVGRFGVGTVELLDFDLTPCAEGERAAFSRLRFRVRMTWRRRP